MQTKILVLDDEKEIADLVALYLNNEGYEVHKFYDSKDALEYMKNNRVDLALLDVMMPEISGFEICRIIREKYMFPVIMLTAKVEDVDKIQGLSLGADDYITKPFNPLELVARVKAQLRRYKKYNPSQKNNRTAICGNNSYQYSRTSNDKQTGTFYIQSEIPCVCISQQQKIQCFDKQEGKWQQYHHDTYK